MCGTWAGFAWTASLLAAVVGTQVCVVLLMSVGMECGSPKVPPASQNDEQTTEALLPQSCGPCLDGTPHSRDGQQSERDLPA